MKRRRPMTALQRKYFGKRHKAVRAVRRTHKRRKVYMARRGRRSYRSYARKGIGGMKGLIAPIGGGIADRYIDCISPIDGVGSTAIGFILHDPIVKTIGLYKVGFSLGNLIPLPGLSNTCGSNGGML